MNQRIKELALDSGAVATNYGKDINPVCKVDIQKFAELIVKECAEVAAKVGEGYVKMGYVVPLECSNKILEHFGVE